LRQEHLLAIERPRDKSDSLNTVELFAGIGGFRIASDSLGLKTIWANDMNPISCDVYRHAFGKDAIAEGDIRALHDAVPPHDLLTAGFPCQPFSSAGKKHGIRDPRGTLFQEIIRVLNAHSPKWFVLENVKRLLHMEHGSHFASVLHALSELDYFIEWRLLNATHFGLPQNRQRVFIVGTRQVDPSSAKLSLASSADLTSLPDSNLGSVRDHTSWHNLDGRHSFQNWGLCYKGKYISPSLSPFPQVQECPPLADILEDHPDPRYFMDESTEKRIRDSVLVNRLVGGVRVLYNQRGGARMGYTVFGTDGVAPALTATQSRHYERYKVGDRYRRLTTKEYARLQGFSDAHCSATTMQRQYSLYGNAVPPRLVEWVTSQLVFRDGILLQNIEPSTNEQLAFGI